MALGEPSLCGLTERPCAVLGLLVLNAGAQRGDDVLIFSGAFGEYLDGSALYRRYKLAFKRAGLRPLRFHDLRHTFGTQVICNPAVSILQLKAWMGHADIDTTIKSLHYAPRDGEADLVAEALALPSLDPVADGL
jgi:integrase